MELGWACRLRRPSLKPTAAVPAPVPQKVERASLCRFRTEETCDALAHEIERAIVVDPRQVAEDVVTMNSKALLQVDDEEVEVALVYPEDADERAGKLSVCSGIGTAILGYKEGDAFNWRTSNRTRHIRIGKVLYQPEAAGHFHL